MPLSPGLARWLRDRGHDAVHAFTLGLDRAPDPVILRHARDDQRVIITADLDYPRLLAQTHDEGPGLILFRGGNYSEQESIDRLRAALDAVPEDQFPHSIIVIEKARIRQRRLPL